MAISRPKQVSNQNVSALHVDSSVTALVVHNVDASGAYVSPGAGSTQVSIKEILTSSGASVMDSTLNSIGVTIRGGSAAGTEYTDGDVDATPNGGVIFFNNSSNTMRAVSAATPLPVSGTFSASTIVTVSTGSVQVSPVVPGTAATNLGKAEDAQHVTGHVGVMVLGVRQTTPTDLSAGNTDGDYEPLQVNGNGELYVALNGGAAVFNAAGQALVVRSSAANFLASAYQSTNTDLLTRAHQGPGNSSGADAWLFAVTDSSNAVVKPGDGANSAIRVNVVAGAAGGSTQVSIKEILTSSGGSVMDGTNVAIRVNVVAGSAAGSTEVTVRQSTYTDFNTLSRLADRDSSTQVAAILNAAPASTSYGLVTRDMSTGPYVISSVGGVVNVSTGPFVISSIVGVVSVSTGPSLSRIVDRDQSTQVAAVLNATPASTVWALAVREVAQSTGPFSISSVAGIVTISTGPFAISSIAGPVICRSSKADALVTVYQSSRADLLNTVYQSSRTELLATVYQSSASEFKATVRIEDSSAVGIAGSTGPTAVGANGLVTREVMPTIQSTTVLITSTNSTALYTLISSAAGLRQKVFAYFVGSTHTSPSTMIFWSSNAIDRWHVNFGSGSSGITGANMALSPPSWIFHADVANALRVSIEGGSSAASTVIARISIGYFSEA